MRYNLYDNRKSDIKLALNTKTRSVLKKDEEREKEKQKGKLNLIMKEWTF